MTKTTLLIDKAQLKQINIIKAEMGLKSHREVMTMLIDNYKEVSANLYTEDENELEPNANNIS